jgi:TRAP-type C4-dicarboxylate transport system substrate-binding protein
MLSNPRYAAVRPETQDVLRKMMDAYTSYKTQKEILELTGSSSDFMDSMKDSTIVQIRELATFNENTQAAYDALFARLLGD